MADYEVREFTYSNVRKYNYSQPNHLIGQRMGTIQGEKMIKANGEYYYQTHGNHPNFDAIFLRRAGKKSDITYSLTIVLKLKQEPSLALKGKKSLSWLEKLFLNKKKCDIKIVCNEKIFDCHKLVLGCQSDVFEAMFQNKSAMTEARSGELEIVDFEADAVETMLYFMYNGTILDEKMINSDLLRLGEKYNVNSLMDFCVEHLIENLSTENALDVLVASHLTNQKGLFDAATNFVCENRKNLEKTDSWKELMETNPKLANDVVMTMLKLQ